MTPRMMDKRAEIDRIDQELLRLLNLRAHAVAEIGRDKRRRNVPVYDLERESTVLLRLRRANPGPLDDCGVLRIFRRILAESRRIQQRIAAE